MRYSFLPFMETESMRLFFSGVFLGLCGLQDLFTRRIRIPFLAASALLAAGFDLYTCIYGISAPAYCLAALLPGAFLLIPAFAAKGAAGKGDGICFMIAGAFLGWRQTWVVLMAALLLASVCGILLLSTRKADKKTRLPFLAFAAAAWAGMFALRLMEL